VGRLAAGAKDTTDVGERDFTEIVCGATVVAGAKRAIQGLGGIGASGVVRSQYNLLKRTRLGDSTMARRARNDDRRRSTISDLGEIVAIDRAHHTEHLSRLGLLRLVVGGEVERRERLPFFADVTIGAAH